MAGDAGDEAVAQKKEVRYPRNRTNGGGLSTRLVGVIQRVLQKDLEQIRLTQECLGLMQCLLDLSSKELKAN